MRFLFTAFFILLLYHSKAQRTVDVNSLDNVNESMFQVAGGQPYVNVKFVRLVDGTPYFKDLWMKGSAVLNDNKHTASVLLKLNLLDNEVHYLDKQDHEMVATTPIQEIVLSDTITNADFHFIYSSALRPSATIKKGWYLQLTSGKACLFKFFNKSLKEQTPYGSATVEQKIETTEEFYILKSNAFTEIKKIKDLPEILGDNKTQVDDYLKNLNGKNRSTSDKMIALINFYNSLQ